MAGILSETGVERATAPGFVADRAVTRVAAGLADGFAAGFVVGFAAGFVVGVDDVRAADEGDD
jgi:hypothetical protein